MIGQLKGKLVDKVCRAMVVAPWPSAVTWPGRLGPVSVSVSFIGVHGRSDETAGPVGHGVGPSMDAGERP